MDLKTLTLELEEYDMLWYSQECGKRFYSFNSIKDYIIDETEEYYHITGCRHESLFLYKDYKEIACKERGSYDIIYYDGTIIHIDSAESIIDRN